MLASETEKEEVRAARGGILVLWRSSLRKDTSDHPSVGIGIVEAQTADLVTQRPCMIEQGYFVM